MADMGGGFGQPAEETLAVVLREIRKARGLSQGAVAERTGLSLRGYSDLECGRTLHPHRSTLERISDRLGLSADEHARLIRAGTRRPRPVSQSSDQSAAAAVPAAAGQHDVSPQQIGHSRLHWLRKLRAPSVKSS